jgi:hypothetical protein
MISWVVTTTADATTDYLASANVESSSFTRTASASNTGPFFGGSFTLSSSSSHSASGSTFYATTSSNNESARFFTSSTFVSEAFASASAETNSLNFTNTANNTVFYYSTSSQGTGTQLYSTTFSILDAAFSATQQTSTTNTATVSALGALSSGLSIPGTAVAWRSTGGRTTTSVATSITGASATTTASRLTTTQSPVTWWFFPSISKQSTQTVTTSFGTIIIPEAYATVYQAAPNEVIYLISEPTSFASAAIAARDVGVTVTRATIAPAVSTLTREFSAVSQISDTTTTRSIAIIEQTTRTITQFGPDAESSTYTWNSPITTSSSAAASLNYEFSSLSTSSSEAEVFNQSETTYWTSSTVVSYSANEYANSSIANLIVPANNLTSQNRFGKMVWDIAGQEGLDLTPSSAPFNVGEVSAYISRGRKTVVNTTSPDLTIESPSVTYKTTIGTNATTQSTMLGVAGSATSIADNIAAIEHLGGGGYAQSWTAVDRVYPDYVYRNLINEQSATFAGNDTSYEGQSATPISRLTAEPHLYGAGDGTTAAPNAVLWTEYRNSATVI